MAKKVFGIVLKVITWLVVIFTVFVMVFTIVSTTAFDKQNGQGIFGFKFLSVLSDSMSKSDKNADMDVHFTTEDIVIIKTTKDAFKDGLEYKEGDIIAFNTQKEIKGKMQTVTVTHMVHSVIKNDEGKVIGYKTFGTNTGSIDKEDVEPQNILGKYVGKIPKGATMLAYLKTVPGYIVCILVPFLVLIGYNGLNCIMLFRRYKKEQLDEMNAEKEKLENERNEALKMMQELQALKEQLANNAAAAAPVEDVATAEATDTSDNGAEVDANSNVNAENTEIAAENAEETAEITEEPAEETVAETKAEEEVTVDQPVEETVAEETTDAESPVEVAENESTENQPAENNSAMDELEAEKQKNLEMAKELEALKTQMALEEERKKTLEMMKELEALKAQLAKNAENNGENKEG